MKTVEIERHIRRTTLESNQKLMVYELFNHHKRNNQSEEYLSGERLCKIVDEIYKKFMK